MVEVYKILGNLTPGTTSVLRRFTPKTTIVRQYAERFGNPCMLAEDLRRNLRKMQPG